MSSRMFPAGFMADHPRRNTPSFGDGSLSCTPYQTNDSILEVGSDSMFGSHLMVASPSPVNDLGLELAERQKVPPGGFYGELGTNDWTLEYSNTHSHTYMRAGPSYDYPTRSAPRSHSLTHNRTSVSISSMSGCPFPAMHSPRNRPFDIQRELTESDGRSFSLPPMGPGLPLPAMDPRFNYPGYQPNVPSVSAGASHLSPDDSQWSTPSPQICGDPAPTSLEGEAGGPLCQVRVGSDRTREISRLRRTNPDKKLIHCPIPGCGATITSKHNYKSHVNSHYGVKPYACGQGPCSKRFGTSAEAKRHRANHCQHRSG